MNEKIAHFFRVNDLWKIKTHVIDLWEGFKKDTPIYITGDFGPQGKTTLKKLFLEDGYTNVLEMFDVFSVVCEQADKLIDSNKKAKKEQFIDAEFKLRNEKVIKDYMKKGIVIDFGHKFLFLKGGKRNEIH